MEWTVNPGEFVAEIILALIASGTAWQWWVRRQKNEETREARIGRQMVVIINEIQEFAYRFGAIHRVVMSEVAPVNPGDDLWSDAPHCIRIYTNWHDQSLPSIRETVNEVTRCDAEHVRILSRVATRELERVYTDELPDGTLKRIYSGSGVYQSELVRVRNGAGLVFLSMHCTERYEPTPEFELAKVSLAERVEFHLEGIG